MPQVSLAGSYSAPVAYALPLGLLVGQYLLRECDAHRQASLPPFTPPTKCQPPSPISTKLSEVRGTTPNAELWALLFPTSGLPIKARQEIKIVWRMTGSGDIHLKAYNPGGKSVSPVWGPEEHGGSNWNRPGAEWGTGFNFPTPGCWNIHVERTNAFGDVWFNVV